MKRFMLSLCRALPLIVALAIFCTFSTHNAFADEEDSSEIPPAYALHLTTSQEAESAVVVSGDDGALMVAGSDCADDAVALLRLKLEEKDGCMTIWPFEGALTSCCLDGSHEYVSLGDRGSEGESVECFLLEKDDGTVSIECGSNGFWTVDESSGRIALSDEAEGASQSFILREAEEPGSDAAQASYGEGELQSEAPGEEVSLYAGADDDSAEGDVPFEEPGGESYYEDDVEDSEGIASERYEEAIDDDLLSDEEDVPDSASDSESSDLLETGDDTIVDMVKVVSFFAGAIMLALIVSAISVRCKSTGISDCRKMR